MKKLPLEDTWKITKATGSANKVLGGSGEISITTNTTGGYAITSRESKADSTVTWNVSTGADANKLVSGTVAKAQHLNADYSFVIVESVDLERLKKKIIGLVFATSFGGPGGGSDPGAFESDEQDIGPRYGLVRR